MRYINSNFVDFIDNIIVKTTNLQSSGALDSSRVHTGNMGIDQSYSYEYKIYVHKMDYETAVGLIK